MANQNTEGNYLKIIRIDDSDLTKKTQIISWELWLNKAVRQSPTNFDKPQNGNTILSNLEDKLNTLADATKSIKENRISVAYNCLLELPSYSDWVNC